MPRYLRVLGKDSADRKSLYYGWLRGICGNRGLSGLSGGQGRGQIFTLEQWFWLLTRTLDWAQHPRPSFPSNTFPKLPQAYTQTSPSIHRNSQPYSDPPTPHPHFYFALCQKRKIGLAIFLVQTDFPKFSMCLSMCYRSIHDLAFGEDSGYVEDIQDTRCARCSLLNGHIKITGIIRAWGFIRKLQLISIGKCSCQCGHKPC